MRTLLATGLSLLALTAAGCRPLVPCSDEEPCDVDFLCLPDSTGTNYCMAECTPSRDLTVCIDGSLCIPTGADNGACYTGGRTPVGSNCSSHLDCVRGAMCVGAVGTDEAECFHACDLGATAGSGACPMGLRCTDTTAGNGFCI